MPHAYPLMLDVADRPVVVIGGGKVGARKVAGLLAAGATDVTVVSPEFHADLPHEGVKRVVGRYESKHLAGAKLAFAATNVREVNDSIVADARARGILVQRVDGDEERPGDFSTPAVHRQGPLIIAVSTGGNPPLAAEIRDRLAEQVDPIWPQLAGAMLQLRPTIIREMSPDDRPKLLRRAASPEAIETFRTRGLTGLKDWLFTNDK